MSAQPHQTLHGSLRRLHDDVLVYCLSWSMSSVDDYCTLCRVSHRFRRLAATRRVLAHTRVLSSRFTDAHCAALALSSQSWTYVDLSWSIAGTDAGLAALAPLTSLTSLNLAVCKQITDVGVAALAPLISLASLTLGECNRITDVGVAALAPLTSLTSLDLCCCNRITDAGVAALAPLTSLTSLDLRCCFRITDEGVAALAHLISLVVHR